jgi:Ni/Co efflux regulator RcnB
MKTILAIGAACAVFAAPCALAASEAACGQDAQSAGMQARMNTVRAQMDRIEWTTDRGERDRLLDLNTKHVQEGLREARRRDLAPGCRLEVLNTLLETMVRHEQVRQEADGR